MTELLHELRHRKTRKAHDLREEVIGRIERPSQVAQNHAATSANQISVARDLTDAQRTIVEAPLDAQLLVTAGPGTGKTHVLVHRIAALIGSTDIAPASEILVLTFSRAAAGEARKRVRAAGGRAAWVRAVTFDSFATGLLAEFDPEGRWIGESYDARIRAATRLILEDEEVAERLRGFRHIFVDELQDVVGARADLVLAILSRAECGWTLFGDPAQGIYNFQLSGRARAEGAAALYRALRERFSRSVREERLAENFRAFSSSAKVGLWAGTELNDVAPDYPSIRSRLHTTVLQLPVAPPASMLPSLHGSIGILSSWNGQALLVSRELWERGVDHRVRRAAADRVVPAWVALLLAGVRTPSLGRRAFESLWRGLSVPDLPSADEAWSQLRALDPGPPTRALDVDRVVSRLRARYLPDEFEDRTTPHVTVSTIHRAKGLEYDHVFVVPVPERNRTPDDVAEEARLIYVALSRARESLETWPTPDTNGMRVVDIRGDDRWVRTGFRRWALRAFEVQPDDSSADSPFEGTTGDRTAEVVQHYLADAVHPGDPVDLVLADERGDYVINHQGNAIGRTSEAFREALGGQLVGRWKNWPTEISRLFVEGVDSVAGDVASARGLGLTGPGVWLRARIHGLGELAFRK